MIPCNICINTGNHVALPPEVLVILVYASEIDISILEYLNYSPQGKKCKITLWAYSRVCGMVIIVKTDKSMLLGKICYIYQNIYIYVYIYNICTYVFIYMYTYI